MYLKEATPVEAPNGATCVLLSVKFAVCKMQKTHAGVASY